MEKLLVKKILRNLILSFGSAIFLLILLLLIFFISTNVQGLAINLILDRLNTKISGTISIGEYQGNLFRKFIISDFQINDKDSRVLSINELSVNWNISNLLGKSIIINEIQINDVYGNITMSEAGLNLVQLLNPLIITNRKENEPEEPSISGISNLKALPQKLELLPLKRIALRELQVTHLNINYYDPAINHLLSEKIKLDSLFVQAQYLQGVLETKVYCEELLLVSPLFHVQKFNSEIQIINDYIFIDDVSLFTDQSILSGNGILEYQDLEYGYFNFKFKPLYLEDFALFFPEQIPNLPLVLGFDLSLELIEDQAELLFHLTESELDISVLALLENYHTLWEDNFRDLTNNYTVYVDVNNVDVFRYTNLFEKTKNKYDVLLANANIYLNGKGFTLGNLSTVLDIELTDVVYNDYILDRVSLRSNIQKQLFQNHLELRVGNNLVAGDIMLIDPLQKQEYTANLQIQNLRLERLLPEWKVENIVFNYEHIPDSLAYSLGYINAGLEVTGHSFDLEQIIAEIKLSLSDSIVLNHRLDSLYVNLKIDEGTYNLENMRLYTDRLDARLVANGTQKGLNYAQLGVLIKEPQDIMQELLGLNLDFQAILNLEAKGQWDSLQAALFIGIDNITLDDLKINKYNSYHELSNIKALQSNNQILIENLIFGKTVVDEVAISAQTLNNDLHFTLDLNSLNATNIRLIGVLNWFEKIQLELSKLQIDNQFIHWKNKELITLTAEQNYLSLENLSLISLPKTDDDLVASSSFREDLMEEISPAIQQISIEKVEKIGNDIFLKLRINDLIMQELLHNFDPSLNINGTINLFVNFEVVNNVIDAFLDLEINKFSLHLEDQARPFTLESIKVAGGFINDTFELTNKISLNERDFYLNLQLPFLNDFSHGIFQIDPVSPIKMSIYTNELDISFVNLFLPSGNTLRGSLNMDIEAEGNLFNPQFRGKIDLHSGVFRNSLLGAYYDNLNTTFTFDYQNQVNRFNIDELTFDARKKGSFSLNGYSTFQLKDPRLAPQSLLEVIDTNLRLRFKELQVTDSKAIRSNISGTITAENIKPLPTQGPINLSPIESISSDHPPQESIITIPNYLVSGNITTNEVRLNIDELLKINTLTTLPEPILENVLKQQYKELTQLEESHDLLFKMPNIDVNLRLLLPRNVWIVGKNMNMELLGNANLRIIQNNQYLDGNIEINRGFYQYLGKRFNIEQGIISLDGQEIDNPLVNLRANYTFRGVDGLKRKITLIVQGNLNSPELSFLDDDGSSLDEGIAISYILFGRSMDELLASEQGMVSDIMSSSGTGLITSQLSSMVQSKVGFLDLLDLRTEKITDENSENDINQATITFGSYIGKDFFVSYEKEFNITDNKAPQTDILSVEYQINRNIFLNASQSLDNKTGIDLLFKWQKNELKNSRY